MVKTLDFQAFGNGAVRKVKKIKESTCVCLATSLKPASPTGRAALPDGAFGVQRLSRNAAPRSRSES
jgi:hypothetical protein